MTDKLDDDAQPLIRGFNAGRRASRTADEILGISKGLIADGIINPEEAEFLVNWLEKNKEFSNIWPVNVLTSRIGEMLADDIIDEEERKELFDLLQELTGGVAPCEIINKETGEVIEILANMSTTLPLDNPPPEIVFGDRAFCFTGKFCYGSRKECQQEILERGGIIHSRPIQRTHYLVIGLVGSRDWKHSNYGAKILRAVELKDQGLPLTIISETHWSGNLK